MTVNGPFLWTIDQMGQPCIDIDPEIKLQKVYDLKIPFSDFVPALKDYFKVQRLGNGQPKIINVTEDVLIFLSCQMKNVVAAFQEDLGNIETQELLANLFWSFRNYSVSTQNQNDIVGKTDILVSVGKLSRVIEKQEKFVKFMLQFLLNLISANSTTTRSIHTQFIGDIRKFLSRGICVYECSALIYNISLFVTLCDVDILETIFDLYESEEQNEFLCFFVEGCVSKPEVWNVFEDLEVKSRLRILEIIKSQIQKQNETNIPDSGLNTIINSFLKSSEAIIQTYMDNNLKACEISFILQILASISSNEQFLSRFQSSKDIMINAAVWLINVHRLGKGSENCFTPVQKLSECDSINEEYGSHPAFGFKADLIRLIGNMCWKNTQLQNLARSAEIIPIILDCCNMDTKNPFIIQWCILAIRNLCENNTENQKFIAGLHQNGNVSTEILDEMGITLHNSEDGQLKILSLDSLRQ